MATKEQILKAFDILIERYRNPKDYSGWILMYIYGGNPEKCPFCKLFDRCNECPLKHKDRFGYPECGSWKKIKTLKRLRRNYLGTIFIKDRPKNFKKLKDHMAKIADWLEKMRRKYE